MELTFLGTRGNIELRSRRHRRHSALMVRHGGARIMVDCGADWLGRLPRLAPTAIVLTHAHPDHAGGLTRGAPCTVYATAASWRLIENHAIRARRVISARTPVAIAGILFEAFPIVHSVRAPAVGYRITAGSRTVFYAPDVVAIRDPAAALTGIDIYIGDGASMVRPLVRRTGSRRFGHTTIRAQLAWCGAARVPRAIFTHCGSAVVRADERRLGASLRRMARAHDIQARFAYDGLEVSFS